MSESMSKKKDDEQNEISFVVTTNPLANSAANKKRVRSLAALKSWPERRKKSFVHEQGKLPANHGGFVLDLAVPVDDSNIDSAAKKQKIAPPDQAFPPIGAPTGVLHESSGYRFRPEDEEPLFEKCIRSSADFCSCVHCRAERRYHVQIRPSEPPSSKKRLAGGELKHQSSDRDLRISKTSSSPMSSSLKVIHEVGRAEPFGQYPVPYRPWFDYVLHHMMNVFAPRGWPALKITNAEGRRWEWFMTQHALSEPALFYVRLLFATGDLVRLNCVNPGVTLWLQDQAVQAINEALSDPQRATSDALILAVGRIALHETLYGDKNAATTVHRPAQKRMISLRGGMQTLPFPELVKRLMRWSDTVMSRLSGTERLLEDDEQNQNFSMKEHVAVLEKWVPTEGRELSKRVKIADLLSPDPPKPP